MHHHADRNGITRAFDRGAIAYRDQARVQAQVAEQVSLLAQPHLQTGQQVVDLGTGVGILAERLLHMHPELKVRALDHSQEMLSRLPALSGLTGVLADYDELPLETASIDIVVSSAALQWSPDPERSLQEWMRILKPGGWLVFSCFIEGTLHEWKDCWEKTDDFPHVNTLPTNAELSGILESLPHRRCQEQTETITTHFDELSGALNSVRAVGANRVTAKGRRQGMMGRKTWLAFATAYENMREERGLPLSYKVFYGIAQK